MLKDPFSSTGSRKVHFIILRTDIRSKIYTTICRRYKTPTAELAICLKRNEFSDIFTKEKRMNNLNRQFNFEICIRRLLASGIHCLKKIELTYIPLRLIF